MSPGRLVIFCGIPGSGKTTIARLAMSGIENSIHVQTDGVRAMLTHPGFGQRESQLVYDACYGIAREALRIGYFVVLDGTFMRDEYRSEARHKLRRYCTRISLVWVDCSLKTALDPRNSRRESPIPPEKLERICEGFQVPRRALRVDSSILSPGAASEVIVKALKLDRPTTTPSTRRPSPS